MTSYESWRHEKAHLGALRHIKDANAHFSFSLFLSLRLAPSRATSYRFSLLTLSRGPRLISPHRESGSRVPPSPLLSLVATYTLMVHERTIPTSYALLPRVAISHDFYAKDTRDLDVDLVKNVSLLRTYEVANRREWKRQGEQITRNPFVCTVRSMSANRTRYKSLLEPRIYEDGDNRKTLINAGSTWENSRVNNGKGGVTARRIGRDRRPATTGA